MVRFMPAKAPYVNKKNGAAHWSLARLVDRFYYSRFNRDNLCGLSEGEDIDNSRQHRLYNKADLEEVFKLFFEYLEWAIIEENLGKIRLTNNMDITRTSSKPKLKRANIVDQIKTKDRVKDREYYVTPGKYKYELNLNGEAWERIKALREKDPELTEIKKNLQKEADERNKNEGITN